MRRAASIGPVQDSPIGTTLERHLLDRQRRMPEATGDFTGLFQQISLAAKIIGSRVSRAGLSDILGLTGTTNVQGRHANGSPERALALAEPIQWASRCAPKACSPAPPRRC